MYLGRTGTVTVGVISIITGIIIAGESFIAMTNATASDACSTAIIGIASIFIGIVLVIRKRLF